MTRFLAGTSYHKARATLAEVLWVTIASQGPLITFPWEKKKPPFELNHYCLKFCCVVQLYSILFNAAYRYKTYNLSLKCLILGLMYWTHKWFGRQVSSIQGHSEPCFRVYKMKSIIMSMRGREKTKWWHSAVRPSMSSVSFWDSSVGLREDCKQGKYSRELWKAVTLWVLPEWKLLSFFTFTHMIPTMTSYWF